MSLSASNALVAERTKQIVDLHLRIEASLRRSVQDAVKIGELISAQKDALPHGDFLPWIERELPFSRQTADNYRRLYEHRAKVLTVGNLTEAYQVAQIEDQRQHPKARPEVPPEVTEAQRQRHEDFIKRIKEEPLPKPEPRVDYDAVLKEAHEAQESINRGQTIFESGGPEAVTTVLLEELETLLAALPDDIARHHVINALIKALRQKSVELNRKAVSA